jgi:hypothetical protein
MADAQHRTGRTAGAASRRLAAIGTLALALGAGRAGGQAVRLGVVMDQPREALERLWSDEPRQVERAYCVAQFTYGVYEVSRETPAKVDTIFRVLAVREAPVASAGPSSIEFECPDGQPEMHTHTPTTCAGDDVKTCTVGGLNAWSCQPSRQDLEKLVARGDPFGIIQCDRRSFRFYYPHEYGLPSQVISQDGGAPRRARGNAKRGAAPAP